MIEKRVLTPEQIGKLVPHWPEVDVRKVRRITQLPTREIKLRNSYTGGHDRHTVVDAPPIITCPSGLYKGRDYILNGKHRAVLALQAERNLAEVHVTTRQDIIHCLSPDWHRNLSVAQLLESFDERYKYELHCQSNGITDIADLLRKALETQFTLSNNTLQARSAPLR